MFIAAHRDLVAETGTDFAASFQWLEPAGRTTVDNLVAGDVVSHETGPLPVYSTVTRPDGRVELRLGKGTYWEPSLLLDPTVEALKLEPVELAGGRASWAPKLDSFFRSPPEVIELPLSWDAGSKLLTMTLSRDWQRQVDMAVDFFRAGPSGTTGRYDIVADVAGKRHRIVEGALTFVRSTATDPWPSDILEGANNA